MNNYTYWGGYKYTLTTGGTYYVYSNGNTTAEMITVCVDNPNFKIDY